MSKDTPKKRGGRPKGLPKTGGRKRSTPPSTQDVQSVLSKHRLAVVKQQLRIASGERIKTSGPTGKVVWAYPSLPEQIRAGEQVAKLLPDVQLDQPYLTDADAMRRAVYEDLLNSMPPDSVTVTESLVDKDGGVVESLDPFATDIGLNSNIANVDLEKKITAKEPADRSPKIGDRFELGAGFFCVFDKQAGSEKEIFRCYNSEGQECAIKITLELCRKWFRENTTIGRELAEKEAAGEEPEPQGKPTLIASTGRDSTAAVDAFYDRASTNPRAKGIRVITSTQNYRVRDRR